MDLLSSLAAGNKTRLPTDMWTVPQDDGHWTIDSWSCHTVLLVAEVHNLLCDVREQAKNYTHLLERWKSLHRRIKQHGESQPLEFQPLVNLAPTSCNENNPFETFLYVNPAVSAAVQMFDLARFLHLLARPALTHEERTTWFAKASEEAKNLLTRVIANSIANRDPINWATAVQLLHVAGLAVVGHRYRKALLICLEDIQRETGWNTQENIHNLLDWWGWSVPLRESNHSWRAVYTEVGHMLSQEEQLLRQFELRV